MVKKNRNWKAFWLTIIASIFLFISGRTGTSEIIQIEKIIFRYFDYQILKIFFLVLFIIASFGAFSVLIGGFLVLKRKYLAGRIFIFLGSGAGILSFIFNLIISIMTKGINISSYLSYSSVGVVFAILAQYFSSEKNTWYRRLIRKLR